MNQKQIIELAVIKKLIKAGKKRFEPRLDRDYVEALYLLDITEEEAWEHILNLKPFMYFPDSRYDLTKDNEALIFKKMIKGKVAYIKIKREYHEDEEVVCLSFHEDGR